MLIQTISNYRIESEVKVQTRKKPKNKKTYISNISDFARDEIFWAMPPLSSQGGRHSHQQLRRIPDFQVRSNDRCRFPVDSRTRRRWCRSVLFVTMSKSTGGRYRHGQFVFDFIFELLNIGFLEVKNGMLFRKNQEKGASYLTH